jgi:multidrug efflux pump subunit AcrB/outer membrane protein TolC
MVKASLQHRQVTLSILAIVFAFGIYSLLTMPRREDPKMTMPQGLVVTYYPGATAAQVEKQVTRKIEQCLFQFEEVRKVKTYSTSRDGVSVITVALNDNVKKPDVFWSKLNHQLIVTKNTDLPSGIRGPVVNSGFGDTEAMLIAIESKQATYRQLRDYCQFLEDRLSTIPTTGKIKRLGDQKEQITIYFDSDKLSQYGISLQQIINVLKSQNVVGPTGEVQTESNSVSLYTNGYYDTQSEIANQIVGTSKTGEVVRLGDIATTVREYAEPTSSIKVNGNKAVIVAVQMNEGNNIVVFGKEVNRKLTEVSKLLPSNVKLTIIVNQPALVNENISHFLKEFLLSIIAVIIVVVFMLPFRIAAVAATAIPMTIAVTFAVLHVFGIELHQVSLSSMIVVLGMVVDDAIVVADNYVELLDNGIDRWTAAWRSATELIIPVLTATITIIAAFVPMLVISGVIGEFIRDLPLTVSVSLLSSFVVSMVMTPMLCYAFIKKGLKSSVDVDHRKQKWSLLTIMQTWYNIAIEWSARHQKITAFRTILTIVLTFIILAFAVRQKFFPYAERNQFSIELWMPTGTKYEVTKQAALRLENMIKNDSRITSYAVFAGTSAPRVYYNFSPEFSATNYAQLLINTQNSKATERLAKELEQKIDTLIPEGFVQVKLMQQGQTLKAPVEVRIYGDDINTLRRLGERVKDIIRHSKGSYQVRDDFMQDYYGISIDLKNEASRLGFTTDNIAKLLYTNMNGTVVSTMYEEDNPIDIVLRSDVSKRENIETIQDVYLESPATGESVPLRQIAELTPKWQTGRIMHRDGMRCLTVRSETTDGVLASQLLTIIRSDIEKIILPEGYKIEFGGEYANKTDVLGQMILALVVGLILIFIIIILQFKSLKETAIIMFTILLSYFGAICGLAITHYDFGFMAFMGLISLAGIVCRNAIILLDYTNVLISRGIDIRTAAIEAGKRRLRPVFLTAMAAAVGVTPMILSGSSLWGPLATVIACGVIWSMFMDFFTVPILYMVFIKPKDVTKKYPDNKISFQNLTNTKIAETVACLLCLFLLAPKIYANESAVKYSLQEMTALAVNNNHLLKAKKIAIQEKKEKLNEDKVQYCPDIRLTGSYQYNQNVPIMTFAKGSFGAIPLQDPRSPTGITYSPSPAEDKNVAIGDNNTSRAGVIVYQPLLEIPEIHAGVKAAETDVEVSIIEQKKAIQQIKQSVEKLFYGLLIAQKQKLECELNIAVARAKFYDGESALHAEKITLSNMSGLNAEVAAEEQNLVKTKIQIENYTADLKNLAGIPDSINFVPDPINIDDFKVVSLHTDSIAEKALNDNTDVQIANLLKKKAEYACKASARSYLPDMGVTGGYTYQQGISSYPENNLFVGVMLKWNITDLLSTTYVKHQRNNMILEANENLFNTKDQVRTDIRKAIRKLTQSSELVAAAKTVVEYRSEEVKITTDKQFAGMNIETNLLTSRAVLAKAESELFAAQLNYRMAYSDLLILIGEF